MAGFKTGSQSLDEDAADIAEINIIPLVDVMLVLLIIFMVTAPLSIGGIQVDLPLSKSKGAQIDEDRIVLSITAQGLYFIEKLQIPEATLEEKFKSIYQFRQKKELFIRADQKVPYGKVVFAMSSAKLAGVRKLGMLTNTQAPPAPGKSTR